MVEVKAVPRPFLSRKVGIFTKRLHAVAKGSINGSFFEAVEGVIVSAFVRVCASWDTSVDWMLFIHFCCQIRTPIHAGPCSRC